MTKLQEQLSRAQALHEGVVSEFTPLSLPDLYELPTGSVFLDKWGKAWQKAKDGSVVRAEAMGVPVDLSVWKVTNPRGMWTLVYKPAGGPSQALDEVVHTGVVR